MNAALPTFIPNSNFIRQEKPDISPYPKGWFLICFSDELEKRAILNRTFMGNELIVFRSQSGKVNVVNAYCTHMGVHYGFGASVIGESIECPFYGYCFNTNGHCIRASKEKKAAQQMPRKWHCTEWNGLVLVFHNPDQDHFPSWEIPALDSSEWTPLQHHSFTLKSHPLEIAENGLDVGHLLDIHNFSYIEEDKAPQVNGEMLQASFTLHGPKGILRVLGKKAEGKFTTTHFGLGLSMLSTHISNQGLQSRYFVLSTPIDQQNLALHIAVSTKKEQPKKSRKTPPSFLPKSLLHKLITQDSIKRMTTNVHLNFKIWDQKSQIGYKSRQAPSGIKQIFERWALQFE